MGYDTLLNKTAGWWRKKTATGQAIEDWDFKGIIKCMFVAMTPSERTTAELSGFGVDYKIYIQSKNQVQNGDKLVYSGQGFIIKKVDDIALMGKVFECWATKL